MRFPCGQRQSSVFSLVFFANRHDFVGTNINCLAPVFRTRQVPIKLDVRGVGEMSPPRQIGLKDMGDVLEYVHHLRRPNLGKTCKSQQGRTSNAGAVGM
jgi:hypothetical protein